MRANKTTRQDAAKSVVRILLITAAATVGTIGLMAMPLDDDPYWYVTLILSKAIAVAGWYAAWRLYERWRKTDKWLAIYDMYIGKEDEEE